MLLPGHGERTARFFGQILKSYLLILVIPLVVSLVLAQISASILENEVRKSSQATLEQTRDIVDSRLQELDSLVSQLALDPQVKSFLGLKTFKSNDSTLFDVWDLSKNLPNLTLTNSFIKKFYIHSSLSDVAVSSNEVLLDSRLEFQRIFRYGDWVYPAWHRFFMEVQHRKEFVAQARLKVDGQVQKGLFYLQSLPLESTWVPPWARRCSLSVRNRSPRCSDVWISVQVDCWR